MYRNYLEVYDSPTIFDSDRDLHCLEGKMARNVKLVDNYYVNLVCMRIRKKIGQKLV